MILNRTVAWHDWGISLKADEKHAKRLVEFFELDVDSRSMIYPGSKEGNAEDVEDCELTKNESTVSRGLAATANYLSADRYDMQFAAKELCRDMAIPKTSSMRKMKMMARYFLGHPELEIRYENQPPQSTMTVYVDSDWAGCLDTRRSTSGGVMCLGGHCVKSWASTQAILAISSGEAEFYALVEGASRALGGQSLCRDLGRDVKIKLFTDSSAAKGIAHRNGIGKMRHLETKYLWIQDVIKNRELEVCKVLGTENPGDIGTKHLSVVQMKPLLRKIGLFVKGRAD